MSRNGWKRYKLSQIMEIIGGGTPKTTVKEYWGGNIPWLSVVDFGGGNRRVYKTEKTITEKGLEESSTTILKKGQVIISARGTVGEVAQLGRDMAFNQSCYGLDGRTDIITNDFLYYLVKDSVNELKRNTHGAVFDTITRQTFDCIDVNVPALPTQKQIAKILGDLDEKIELNHQMNKTLESIAQAVFKKWFVDFEFHGYEKTKFVNGLPEGWREERIGDVVRVVGGSTPSTENPSFWDGNIFWATPKDFSSLNSDVLLKTERQITEIGLKEISSGLLPKGSVLLSSRAPIGYIAISEIPVAINQGFIGMICDGELPSLFVKEWLKLNLDVIKERANGTTFLEISKSSFKPIPVIVPDADMIGKYNAIADSIHRQTVCILRETEKLITLRDSLLPKLMTGEVAV